MVATHEDKTDTSSWEWVIENFQMLFRDCRTLTECTWHMVVLIPKGGGEFRDIGIVEGLWNVLSGVINQQIGSSVHFHYVLHGLRVGWVTGNTAFKAKLIQQHTDMR